MPILAAAEANRPFRKNGKEILWLYLRQKVIGRVAKVEREEYSNRGLLQIGRREGVGGLKNGILHNRAYLRMKFCPLLLTFS